MANMSGKDTYINDTDERDNGTDPSEYGSTASSERGGSASPEHDDAIHDPKHAVSADEEAVDSSSHAEKTSSDDRSGALTAKAASGESRGSHAAKATSDKDRGSHAAKATSDEDNAAHAKEVPSTYLKKAGDFLGLHKKASAIAAAIALCVVVGIGAVVASSSRPAPNGIPLSSDFVSYAANAVATTTDAAADEAAARCSLPSGPKLQLSKISKNPLQQPPKTSKAAATPLASRSSI